MSNPRDINPIAIRDLIVADEGEPHGHVRESTIRNLIARGWPVAAILAEFPGVSDAEVRRAIDAEADSKAA